MKTNYYQSNFRNSELRKGYPKQIWTRYNEAAENVIDYRESALKYDYFQHAEFWLKKLEGKENEYSS